MKDIKNLEIRQALKRSGLTHWEMADHLGICSDTFSRWLRHELPEADKERILKLIDKLAEEGE
ncbi:MAG: hypothetical protein IKG15_07075 [Solobacterium sp.]|nr:hypothetical protein [Solobacterium sp.]